MCIQQPLSNVDLHTHEKTKVNNSFLNTENLNICGLPLITTMKCCNSHPYVKVTCLPLETASDLQCRYQNISRYFNFIALKITPNMQYEVETLPHTGQGFIGYYSLS
jgi:hypothetical protein